MPLKSLKPCRKVGCTALTRSGYCEQHTRYYNNHYDDNRESANKRGYNYKWQKYRAVFLAKNPFCTEHLKENKYVIATVVDHIVPHKGDMVLFWNEKNHQGLCESCHSRKTVREDGGFGNPVAHRPPGFQSF